MLRSTRLFAFLLVLMASAMGGWMPSLLAAPENLPAFPGAQGYGSTTPGGRGGRVIFVTNLNDSGPGSLREALAAKEPRMVLFKVGGTITLNSDIKIEAPYLTVAGQTASGQGIQIKGAMIVIKTHDVVIRYLKVRPGDEPNLSAPADRDAISLAGGGGADVYNIVIDHCSLIWGPDIGGLSILTNVHDVTVQNTIMGEGPYLSRHPEGTTSQDGHSMAASMFPSSTIFPRNITMHHNLFTSSDIRMPMVIGADQVDLVNNVIYNWGKKAASGNPRRLNLVNNMFVRGPQTTTLEAWSPHLHSTTPNLFPASVFEQGNVTDGFTTVRGEPSTVYAAKRFGVSSIGSEQSAQDAYATVLQTVGATLPIRDSVDTRIVDNVVKRSGKILNANEFVWPSLASGTAPVDTDQDGMPDSWEERTFGSGSSRVPSAHFDTNGNGYTDLEEYLNQLDGAADNSPQPAPVPSATPRPSPTPAPQPTPSDLTPPTVGLVAPAVGATVSGEAVMLSAKASDNVGVAGVQFMINGSRVGAEVTAAPFTVSWNSTTVANGSHLLTAVARDATGNRTVSAAAVVNVSNAGAAPIPGNLIGNAGFELDVDGNGPDEWSTDRRFTRGTGVVQSGSYAGMIHVTDNRGVNTRQVVRNLRPGPYTFSGALNIPPTSDSFTFALRIRWLDASGQGLRTDTLGTAARATGGWQQIRQSLVAPAGTAQARLVITVTNLNATIYVDDFALTAAP
jgi:pectate lyase